jgi:2-polyprenyl-6-methoxyphenol hydroxylase-like FAD-dependent oxidoreductase
VEIAIIGGGLGGLMTALRLEQHGFTPRVYEAAAELQPLGVGIAIQPYGTKEFEELGLLERLNDISVDATESVYFNQYGQRIYGERCGIHMGYPHAQRFVHRGTLQVMLYAAVCERLGSEAVVTGARCIGFEQDDDGVTVKFAPGGEVPQEVRVDVLIGADGIKSVIREQLYPTLSEPHYSGITLWRGTTLMKPYRDGGTILHIGAPSQGSMIVYPIRDNAMGTDLTLINWVVEQNGRPQSVEDWNEIGNVSEIVDMFNECELDFLDVRELLRTSREVYLFPLVDHDPLERWTFGRVTMIGDAAHAMYPRGGNGACSSFVDARVIAEKLATVDDPRAALAEYEAERLEFVNRVVMANRGDGPEVIRRIVEERTGGQRFDDLEKIFPHAEIDAIFQEYHRLAGMTRPNQTAGQVSGFRSVFFNEE